MHHGNRTRLFGATVQRFTAKLGAPYQWSARGCAALMMTQHAPILLSIWDDPELNRDARIFSPQLYRLSYRPAVKGANLAPTLSGQKPATKPSWSSSGISLYFCSSLPPLTGAVGIEPTYRGFGDLAHHHLDHAPTSPKSLTAPHRVSCLPGMELSKMRGLTRAYILPHTANGCPPRIRFGVAVTGLAVVFILVIISPTGYAGSRLRVKEFFPGLLEACD